MKDTSSNNLPEWSTGTNLNNLFAETPKNGRFNDFDVDDEDYKDNTNSRRKGKGKKHPFFFIKIPKERKDYLIKKHKSLFAKHCYLRLKRLLRSFVDGRKLYRPSQNFIRDISIESNKVLLSKTLEDLFTSCSLRDTSSKKKELEVNKFIFDLLKSKLNKRILSEATSAAEKLLMEAIVYNYSIEYIWTKYLESTDFITDTNRVIKKKNYAEIREFNPILYCNYSCYGWKNHNNNVLQTKKEKKMRCKQIFKVVTFNEIKQSTQVCLYQQEQEKIN